MRTGLVLPEKLGKQIDCILVELYRKTAAECVLLADITGQLIDAEGKTQGIDPGLVAALAAGDVAAMAELTRQIGEENPQGSFLHEGEKKSIYLFNVADSFILIVIFQADIPVGLMRLFVRRAAERLHPLTAEFEDVMGAPRQVSNTAFSTTLAQELDSIFEGL